MQINYRLYLSLLFFLSISVGSFSQKAEILQQINDDVWIRFYHSFDSLDHTISEEIHTEDVMRIPANQNIIIDYNNYMEGNRKSFAESREKNETRNIELRFFERLANDSIASERGIYRFTLNKGTSKERNFYGQFHVLLVKREGKWKILMDYDSNENDTIDEEDFRSAHAMDDLNTFTTQQ